MEGKDERPSLFLFDIQPEQVEPLQAFMDSSLARIQNMSPLIGARLLKIKGESVNVEVEGFGREAERARHFRNRTLNLSARAELNSSEKLVSGRDFSGVYDAKVSTVVEASLEVRYAQRLGLELGDHFTVDILGMEVEARVINLRKVRWTSFQPNFFVVLQPGLLEDAPRTYLASIVDDRGPKDLSQASTSIGISIFKCGCRGYHPNYRPLVTSGGSDDVRHSGDGMGFDFGWFRCFVFDLSSATTISSA